MKNKSEQDLQVVVLPGRAAPKGAETYYNEAYKTWKTVWKSTLLELDGSDELYSDHFTRQDYHVTIFHKGQCAALTAFRRVDLRSDCNLEDSWFKPWPKDLLNRISKEYAEGIVVSWVTIHPEFRRTNGNSEYQNLEISPRLFEAINYFLETCGNNKVSFGVTRNNRSVNKFCAYAGSETLQKDATLHGVDVDLITWTIHSIYKARNEFPKEAKPLWDKAIFYFDEPLILNAPKQTDSAA